MAFGSKPDRSRRIFQDENILSTPSFGGEVKPSVQCHRFTVCKRFLNDTWKSCISDKIHRPFLAHTFPPLVTRISGRRLVVKVGKSKNNKVQLHLCLPGSLGETTGGESLNIKGSKISDMAAAHPGHQLPGALQKEEEEASGACHGSG